MSKAHSSHSRQVAQVRGTSNSLSAVAAYLANINTHQESVCSSVFERETVGTVRCYFYAVLAQVGLTS